MLVGSDYTVGAPAEIELVHLSLKMRHLVAAILRILWESTDEIYTVQAHFKQ